MSTLKVKSWYKSKTMVFGGALAALGLAILALPEFQALIATLPTEYVGYATLAVSVVTVVLRYFTDTGIK